MADLLDFSDDEIVSAFNRGCQDCIESGGTWVNLRMCLICGRVGCCDSSPGTHATKHSQQVGHTVVRSIMPGESWRFDYATGKLIE